MGYVKNREKNTIRPAVTYDPPFVGTPFAPSRYQDALPRSVTMVIIASLKAAQTVKTGH